MSETPDKEKVHELAGGWITERADSGVPFFLKISYIGFTLFAIAYLFLYKSGETGHPTRGPHVLELNKALEPVHGGVIALVAALLVVFSLGLYWLAFRRGDVED